MEMTNNNLRNGLGHHPEANKTCETDPLQMLAKQCDTISGDEEGGGKGKGKTMKGSHQQQQQNGLSEGGGKGGTMMSQKAGTQTTKAKSPNKHLADPSCLPTGAAVFPNGFLPPHPAQLAALMNPFLGPMSQQRPHHPMGHPPPFPLNNFGLLPPHNGTFGGPHPQFVPPPGTPLNLMQQLMAAVQQQMPPPHLLPGGMFPSPHSGPAGIPLPPSMPMPLMKPDQPNMAAQTEAEAAALAQAMAMFPGQNPFPGSAHHQNAAGIGHQSTENGAFAQHLLQQPVQALLMAAACGQLPQFPCFYKMPGGALCGRVFQSDDQLFAHFKSAHIAQMSSPSAVSSTTEGPSIVATTIGSSAAQTPTTTTTGGGKIKAQGNKNSPSSSRSTPTNNGGGQQNQLQINTQKPHSNPGPMVFNGGWPPHILPQMGVPLVAGGPTAPPQTFLGGGPTGGAGGHHRFHPYMIPNSGQQNGGQSSKNVPQQAPIQPPPNANQLQQMAMALNLMATGGLGLGPPPPQIGGPDLGHPNPQSQSLAALAAMANSIGGNNQPTGQSTNSSSASVGAGSG